MPQISRLIKGCGYNPEAHVLAFRLKDMSVVVERKRILINKIKDETEVKMVIDWLASIVNGSNEQEIKTGGRVT